MWCEPAAVEVAVCVDVCVTRRSFHLNLKRKLLAVLCVALMCDRSVLEHVLVVLGDDWRLFGLRGGLFLHGGQSDMLRSVCVCVLSLFVGVLHDCMCSVRRRLSSRLLGRRRRFAAVCMN